MAMLDYWSVVETNGSVKINIYIYQTHAMFCRHPVKSNDIKHITPSYTNIAKVIRYGQQLYKTSRLFGLVIPGFIHWFSLKVMG